MARAHLVNAVCCAVSRGQFREALAQYTVLNRTLFPAGADTFAATAAVKACARLPHPYGGPAIHAQTLKLGLAPADVYLHTALVDLYARNGSPTLARKLFEEMPARNIVSWNVLLSGLLRSGQLSAARELFEEMPLRDAVSWNAMISGHAKAGDMAGAASLFGKMPAAERNAESWNGLICGFVGRGDMRPARNLFDEMSHKSLVSYITLIGGYARTGDVKAAELLFEEMPHRSTAAWNAMLTCYSQNGRPREALRLFLRMQKTHVAGESQPDGKTFTCLLSACSQLGDLLLGRWAETHLAAGGIPLDDHLRTALVDLHAKCGDIDRAFQLFLGLVKRDVVSYSAMILGCGINGRSAEAISLYREMMAEDRITPNAVTFVGLLVAYSHAGLVEEGCRCFASMAAEHGISPTADHYAAVVDLLGRAGRLEEAYEVARGMPVAANSGVWGALLLACGLHRNVELGEVAARRYAELEPGSSAQLVILANIYGAAGRWEEARALWKAMEDGDVAKIRGCSWAQPG